MHRPLHTLKIWGAGVNSPQSYGAEFVFFCFFVRFFVCPSRYVARHRKHRRCVYVLNLGGTGRRPPDSFSYRSSFHFRSRSRSCSTTSGNIFYCSGSRQLNHSSYKDKIHTCTEMHLCSETDNFMYTLIIDYRYIIEN